MHFALVALLAVGLIAPVRPVESVSVFVELAETAAVDAGGVGRARGARERTAVKARRVAESVSAVQVAHTSNAVAGVMLNVTASRLSRLARMPEVRAVHRIVPKKPANASAAQLTRAASVWKSPGLLGDGVRIGVVDTGIDYQHADFGGPGTFPTAKVVGGYDFVGDDYTAEPGSVPQPDADPMDCKGHGSHVAGIAAGFGVNADGSTYRGPYDSVELDSLRIGPGTAPRALLYALRVFGCTGSTGVVAQALDWALDPNGDGDFSDHLDVVNLSLGFEFSAPDDPESIFVRKLVRHGVVVVAAAGNSGDLYDVGGSPGNVPEAIGVASSRDAFEKVDAATADGKSVAGQYSDAYTKDFDLERPVVRLSSNVDGCKPITESLTGKFVWLEWDDNPATRACGSATRVANAQTAGADGVLVPTTALALLDAVIGGTDGIPAFRFAAAASEQVRPAVAAGTLRVRLASSLKDTLPLVTPELTDKLAPYSSRGPRTGKPDLAAPGDSIYSAAAGTGSKGMSENGTSMAAPHAAGIAALVRQAHPAWTVEEVKAALMNTAAGVVRSDAGVREAPMRVGAGRVDALGAVSTDVLAMADDPPGAVGVSFGTVEAGGPLLLRRGVRLVNKGTGTVRLSARYEPITSVPGVSIQPVAPYVVIPPGGTVRTEVLLRISDPAALRKTPDPTMDLFGGRQFLAELSGLLMFTSDDRALRVPVYAAPKPVSRLKVAGDHVAGQGLGQPDYRARMTVLKLGGTSPRLPDCGGTVQQDCAINRTARGGDLRYVGATATPDLLAFGVATWDTWANLGVSTVPFVVFEVGGERFAMRVVKPTDADGNVTADVWLVRTTADGGEVVDEQPLNGRFGDVDTNVFDSEVVVMPVSRAKIPAGPVTYVANTAGWYSPPGGPDGVLDVIRTETTFDYSLVVPELSTVVKPGDRVPDGDLVLFHHNASGNRALTR